VEEGETQKLCISDKFVTKGKRFSYDFFTKLHANANVIPILTSRMGRSGKK
jgi:hypothetical protein